MKNNNKDFVKKINLGFGIVFGAIVLINAASPFINRKEINTYENRPANFFIKPTIARLTSREFQDKVEDTYADQIPFSTTMKQTYNTNVSHLKFVINDRIVPPGDYYTPYNGLSRYRDHIVFGERKLENLKEYFDVRIKNVNEAIKANPDLEFFTYYIEKDTDINFETNKKTNVSNYILDNINLDNNHKSVFTINNFDEFEKYFFKSDHHWNNHGYYKGYTEVIKLLLGNDETPLVPTGEVLITTRFNGYKAAAASVSTTFFEDFNIFEFDLPEFETTIDGVVADYGHPADYFEMDDPRATYGGVHGGDEAQVHFNTNRPEKKNIMVIGESFDNPILKLIASHYNNTYSIDLRNYDETNVFKFAEYAKEHDIDQVLLIGNVDLFVVESFNLEV